MNCTDFLAGIDTAMTTSGGRAHARSCADCAAAAIATDSINLFRTIEKTPAVPKSEFDEFVADVVGEIRLRETEKTVEEPAETPRWVGLAMVAAILAAIAGGLFIQDRNVVATAPLEASIPADATAPANAETFSSTLPVVEGYSNNNAMIVELPAETTDDIRIVMIFDETLPQDL
ncbi:MAG: hypothetical protein KY459_03230 [Acidobacteria bacterium]|nr:hypothetical protein [Acidobacteriota bacterium]